MRDKAHGVFSRTLDRKSAIRYDGDADRILKRRTVNMLTFIVTFKCRPGTRETFLEKVRAEGIDAASRAE